MVIFGSFSDMSFWLTQFTANNGISGLSRDITRASVIVDTWMFYGGLSEVCFTDRGVHDCQVFMGMS